MQTNSISLSSNVSPVMEELKTLGVDSDVEIIEVDTDGYVAALVIFVTDLLAMSGAWWLDNPQRRISRNPTVSMGTGVSLGNCVGIGDNVNIGNETSIGKRAVVTDDCSLGNKVTIGDDAVLGMGVIVADGVTIGTNTVIGAWSVITKDVPNNRTISALTLY